MKRTTAVVLGLLLTASCSGNASSGLNEPGATYEPQSSFNLVSESPTPAVTLAKDRSDSTKDEVTQSAKIDYPVTIVSLSPTATEMLFVIGAGEQVVAVDNYSDFPPQAPVVEELSGWNPNVEAIASYQPDLVILSDSGIQEELELLGIEVFVAPAATDLEDVYRQMLELGVLTGKYDAATLVVAYMREQIGEILASIEQPDQPLSYYHELDDTLYSVTSSTFVGYIYSLAGLINIADPADSDGSSWGYPQLTQEFVLESDPDIIFFADAECCGQSIETIASRPGWSELKAVRNGNVIEINNDVSSRWGPRLVDFLATVSAAVSAAKVE